MNLTDFEIKLILETGMTPEEARNSWANKNQKEALVWMEFFNKFKEALRGSLRY